MRPRSRVRAGRADRARRPLPRPGLAAVSVDGVDGLVPRALEKKLVIHQRRSHMKRAAVHVAINGALKELPDAYDEVRFEAALAAVYEQVYESYWGDGKSLYVEAPS
jgi:hypothetical protein